MQLDKHYITENSINKMNKSANIKNKPPGKMTFLTKVLHKRGILLQSISWTDEEMSTDSNGKTLVQKIREQT